MDAGARGCTGWVASRPRKYVRSPLNGGTLHVRVTRLTHAIPFHGFFSWPGVASCLLFRVCREALCDGQLSSLIPPQPRLVVLHSRASLLHGAQLLKREWKMLVLTFRRWL